MFCSRSIRLSASALVLAILCGCAAREEFAVPEEPRLDPDLVQRGAFVFMDRRISGDQTRACATCHPNGGSDGKVYADGAEVAPGTAGGRRTRSLRGVWQTPPYLWDGSAKTMGDAVNRMLQVEMRGAQIPDHDVEALTAYVLSLAPFDRGRVLEDGSPREPAKLTARKGSKVFVDAGCDLCHPAPAFAVPQLADVGSGGAFDVPTLRGVAELPALGHDGRWSSLEEVIEAMLSSQELELEFDERVQLVEYLKLL